jgi:CubicO group peptidase (beta-lactamase class C family)
LLAYYPFDNDFKDKSGNNFNGKATGAVLVGADNKACFFNGGNSLIEVSGVEPLNTVKQLTISCWVNAFSAKQWDAWISKANDNRNNSQWRLGFSDRCANQAEITIFNTGWENYNADFKFELKKWYHLVYLINNAGHKVSVYINGKSIKTFSIGEIKSSQGPLLLGYQGDDRTYYNGLLDETLIYNRLLTEDEIQRLYNNFRNTEKADVNRIKAESRFSYTSKLQISDDKLDSLDMLMWNKVHSNSLAGVEYLIADKNKVIHHQAIGYRDIDKPDTLQKNSLFRIACTARPFTVVSVLMLAEKGLLSLNDPVSKFIPEFREMKVLSNDSSKKIINAKREITIFDLLTGQSGIGYLPEYYQTAGVFTNSKTLKDVVLKISAMPLVHQPGEGYQYGFTTVPDYVVEVVSKKPFNEFIKNNLFLPLEMYDTDYYVPKEKKDRLTSIYSFDYNEGKLKLLEKAENSKNIDTTTPLHTISFVSTTSDYLKFAQMLLNKGKYKDKTILSEKSVELMTSNQLPDVLLGTDPNVSNRGWGMFGWVANENSWDFPDGTYGKDGGNWTSLFWMDKKNELIGIIFLQTNNNYSVIPDFYKMVYQNNDLYGDYLGQTPPGDTPAVFAPGIVSTIYMEHSSLAVSPDGNEIFWMVRPGPEIDRSLYNPDTWISSKTLRRIENRWTSPTGSPYGGEPAFSPDGKRLFFTAIINNNKPGGPYFVEKQGDAWSEPKNIELVERFPELKSVHSPTITRDGTLYFSADTLGKGMLKDHVIYRSKPVNDKYTKLERLPRCINQSLCWNYSPFIAPDESYLIFSSSRPDSPDNYDYGDLYVSFHNINEDTWTEPVNLGEPINTPGQESSPGLSPDGKYLFYTGTVAGRQADIFWVSSKVIDRLRNIYHKIK